MYTSNAPLLAGESRTITLELTVVIPAMPQGLSDWWNYVEISSADDNSNTGDTPPTDADSTPDMNPDNDNDIDPGDDDDDEITENGNEGDDHDDHDPAKVIVGYDLALNKTVSPAGPYSYGDTLTYTITVFNQGGLTVSNVAIYDSLPCGLLFLEDENDDWDLTGSVATTTIENPLSTSSNAEVILKLLVQNCDEPGYDNYYNIAEIYDFDDENGDDPTSDDIDSTPDNDPTNDGDILDNEVNPNPADEEDDHDIEDIVVCDVALINTIAEANLPSNVGDTVKFEVIVENQGNHDVNSISVNYLIPNGMAYLPINDLASPVWNSGTPANADITTDKILAPGESDTVCLYLQLNNLPTDEATEDSWTTFAEITEYTNGDDEVKTTDADSTPNDDPTDDPGGNPGDDTDDELDGNGTGDPKDPAEDSNSELDEDDHDPAIIYICDVAVIIDTEEEGPFSYGDTLKYFVEVSNQGNGDITNIDVQNLFGEGLAYVENAENTTEGWVEDGEGELSLLVTDVIESGDSDTICLYMEIVPDYESDEESWVQNVEVVSFEDPDNPGDPKPDFDSNPDDIPDNDPGGNPNDPDTDDETDGDGSGDPDDENENINPDLDEDDQDVEDIDICDLALINTIVDQNIPPKVGDTVKYEVVVVNQGNVGANSVDIHYLVPNGMSYLPINSNLNPAWSEENVTLLTSTTDAIAPGESDTLCLYLQIENVPTDEVTEESWTTIAEIVEYVDENDEEKIIDVDSNPDDILDNDPGGNPDDETDDELEGDGTGDPLDPTEESDPDLDEDDNDPAKVYICDVAVIIYDELPDEINYYDTLKYNVVVSNQGNGDITEILIANHIPEGFELIETTSNMKEGWEESDDIPGAINVVVEDVLASGESDTICLELLILPVHEDSDEDSWLQVVEVVSFEDPNDPGVPKSDVDSNPDADPDNDPGGNPDDDTDDETDGEGTGDPENPAEDEDPDLDEDDNDPVDTKVLDLALIIQIDSMPPVLPVVPGDELKFIIVVTNQGNTAVNAIELTNYIMDDNLKLSGNVGNGDWDVVDSGKNEYTITEELLPGDKDTVCIYLEVISGAMTDIVTYAEISGSTETDADCYDIDSDPDDNVLDDEGGEPESPSDDHVIDDSEDGNDDGITDEDDHDPAMINGQDLALIVWADHKDPVQNGDDVKFIIRVINQGNITNENIKIANYIPKGFELSANDNNNWIVENDSTVTKILTDTLMMRDTTETCIILTVKEGVNALDLINYAEIVSSTDPDGLDLTHLDIDSKPNMDPDDDTGGQYEDMPDCITDPVIINNDNYYEGAGSNGEDEDDHDPAWVHVFDLATIIYTDQTLPIIPGDDLKFNVEIINQGNMAAQEIDFNIYLPDGFTLSANDNNGWILSPLGDFLFFTEGDKLLPGVTDTICLVLEVLPDFTLLDLIPIVEIAEAMDTLGNDRTNDDLDSTPNSVMSDDGGDGIFSPDDDESKENGLNGNDEDDHDPALPPVLDLAVKIITVDESPKEIGDTVKFEVTLYNQGSLVPQEFTIEDYIPEGLTFFVGMQNDGWLPKGDTSATYNYTKQLMPLTSDTLCIYLILNEDANPVTVVNMVEIIEVIDDMDRDISLLDIDSEADASNENDKGNDLYSEEDNKLEENGRSGFDEDDHDQAFVNMCGELLAYSHVNVSLDEDCEVGLAASMLLIGDLFPNKLYTIEVTDQFGNQHDPNVFSSLDLGKTFTVKICLPLCDDICTWNNITIEDKLKPTIMECPNDTISCVAPLTAAKLPIAEDNCSAEIILIDQQYTKLSCDDDFVGVWERKYIAKDLAGNVSEDTCVQLVYVERTDLSGIVRPPMYIGSNALNCNMFAKLPNGAPTPAVTGVPMIGSNKLYPFEQSLICNGFVDFEDDITFQANCKTRITRTWKVLEWHCDSIARTTFLQFIEIVDKIAPVVTAPADFTVNVDGRNCEASVDLSAAQITDNCSTFDDVFISTGNGVINSNGGEISLPQGVNMIVYNATDACNNLGKDTMFVTVIEEQEPIAICETFTTVSLDNNGLVWLSAESVDDGSFDECDPNIKLEIRRMIDPCNMNNLVWSDQVSFCCTDASAIDNPMVSLRVTDSAGNSNTCMVEVEVQDKNKPNLTCFAPTREVTCAFTYDPSQPALSFDSLIVGGTPCLGSLLITDTIINENLDQCRIGYIDREAIVTFDGKELGRCHQRITFISDNPISESLIKWPKDITITNDACTEFDLDPSELPAGFSVPEVPDGGCNLVGFTKKDQVFPFAGNGACFKIIRTWSVIDWCGRNLNGIIPEYENVQTIYVQNTIAPTITSQDTTVMEESFTSDCSSIPLTLLASATDDCTPEDELQWDYTVTLEDGSTIDGKGPDASGTYPIGSHSVEFTVLDKCGNISKTSYDFIIVTKTAPIASCKSLSTAIIPMDTIGNSDPDAEFAMLTAEMLDYDSYHTCYDRSQLIFSFSTNPNDTILLLDCDNIGKNEIDLYVIDPLGNFSYCTTWVSVIDTNDFDHCVLRLANIEGKVTTADNRDIADTEVHLMSNEDVVELTDETGIYAFSDMELGGEYTVLPSKDGDDMNGVSTLDLVLIQRHILGIQELDNPYKMIAADVNHDDKITASDLVALRKLILGIHSEFQNNTSWRFIDGAYSFPIQDDPWVEEFNEDYFIDYLNGDMGINFIGAKIGDVNNSSEVNVRSNNLESRSFEEFGIEIENRSINAGELTELRFKSEKAIDITGLQIEFDLNGVEIIDIKEGAFMINESKSYIKKDGLRISYDHNSKEVIPNSTTLFSVIVKADESGKLNEMLSISESHFAAEAYDEQLNVMEVRLKWNDSSIEDYPFNVAQNEPNPWQDKTSIEVLMPKSSMINLTIVDISGKVLHSEQRALMQGVNNIILSKEKILNSGVMFYEIEFEGKIVRKKMFSVK